MLTQEDRKYILNEFLRNISHISDKNYQMRVWILGKGPVELCPESPIVQIHYNGNLT